MKVTDEGASASAAFRRKKSGEARRHILIIAYSGEMVSLVMGGTVFIQKSRRTEGRKPLICLHFSAFPSAADASKIVFLSCYGFIDTRLSGPLWYKEKGSEALEVDENTLILLHGLAVDVAGHGHVLDADAHVQAEDLVLVAGAGTLGGHRR